MSEQDMENINSGDESDHDIISTEMLEDIRDGSYSHSNVNRRETPYKIRDRIKKRQLEWKGALKAMQKMGKGLDKVFKIFVKEILQEFPPLGESGSEVSHSIPEPRKFTEVTKLSDDINKTWIKATLKEIKNLINNQTFIFEDPYKDKHVTQCMGVYKAKIQSDGILDKIKLIIVVRGDL